MFNPSDKVVVVSDPMACWDNRWQIVGFIPKLGEVHCVEKSINIPGRQGGCSLVGSTTSVFSLQYLQGTLPLESGPTGLSGLGMFGTKYIKRS